MTSNETFSHETKNNTEKTRLILFYDVTRPQKNRNLQFIAEWLSDKMMSAAVSPTTPADKKTGFNLLSTSYWAYGNNRKKLKAWNKNVSLVNIVILLPAIAFYIIYIIFYL